MWKIIIIIILLTFGSLFYWQTANQNNIFDQIKNQNDTVSLTNQIVADIVVVKASVEPISQANTRVTKKPFGIKVSPADSPVSPEKFAGYHTGVDFETTEAEQNIDVAIYAICDGPLVLKKIATGYGGVVAQSCQINQQDVTVVYGHLKLTSVSAKINQQLVAGGQIGLLGTGYTNETSGERKHLHLSIHQGTTINILGYVQNEAQLADWLDPMTLF